MYTLQHGNSVKTTESKDKRDKYIAAGFQLVEKAPADIENNPPDTENKSEGKSEKKKA